MRTLKHRILGFKESVESLFSKPENIDEECSRLYCELMNRVENSSTLSAKEALDAFDIIFSKLENTIKNTDITLLARKTLMDVLFRKEKEKDMCEMRMANGQGKMESNVNGVKRESNEGRGRFDLIPFEGLEELAKWYEAGAKKYGDRNWEKGVDVQDCANRMFRHSVKACNGWMDEGPYAHFAAVAWNALACITAIKRNPYLNNLFRESYLKELGLPSEETSNRGYLDEVEQKIYNTGVLDHKLTSESIMEDIDTLHLYSQTEGNKKLEYQYVGIPFGKLKDVAIREYSNGYIVNFSFENREDQKVFEEYLKRIKKTVKGRKTKDKKNEQKAEV